MYSTDYLNDIRCPEFMEIHSYFQTKCEYKEGIRNDHLFLFPEKKHLLEASFTLGLSLHVNNILNREQSSSP